jgi:hypothetical protein
MKSRKSWFKTMAAAKRADAVADTSGLESEIDALVYQLYGLTEDEARIVEGRCPPSRPSRSTPRGGLPKVFAADP